MNVSLTPELERYIQEKVESKLYQTASEVVREALRVLKAREEDETSKLEALRRDIQIGLDQIKRSEFIDAKDPKSFLNDIKSRGRARLAARKNGRAR